MQGVEIATSPLAWDYQIYSQATHFSSLIARRASMASGKIMQKLKSQTTINCADGPLTQDKHVLCFSGYQNIIRATKSSWLLALLTTMKIRLISTPAMRKL